MNNLVVREYLGSKIEFKVIDGRVYANATKMMVVNPKKRINDWTSSKSTKELVDAISSVTEIPVTKLIETKQGGIATEQGTWIHEELVLDLAQWLDVKFRLWCNNQISTLIREGKVEIKSTKKLEDKLPMEILTDNGKALNELFTTIGLNIPKELIVATAINTTHKSTGYDFEEVKLLLNKQDEESYHTKSEICKNVGIKSNKVNMALCELGLQEEGSTSMQPYRLTELGKQYAVERSFTNGRHQGYEIKLKKSAEVYIRENLFRLPQDWVK